MLVKEPGLDAFGGIGGAAVFDCAPAPGDCPGFGIGARIVCVIVGIDCGATSGGASDGRVIGFACVAIGGGGGAAAGNPLVACGGAVAGTGGGAWGEAAGFACVPIGGGSVAPPASNIRVNSPGALLGDTAGGAGGATGGAPC